MSQKSEKYARELGRMQRSQGVRLQNLNARVSEIENREWQWLKMTGRDAQEVRALRERVFTLEREQRRRVVSRNRIMLVSGTFAVCLLLIFVSLKIFGMV